MDEQAANRFEVVVEEGVPRGDLYELEQTTTYSLVDRRSNRTIMAFEGKMEAGLSTDSGLWDEYRLSGVSNVAIAADQRSAIIKYHDGREEIVELPL